MCTKNVRVSPKSTCKSKKYVSPKRMNVYSVFMCLQSSLRIMKMWQVCKHLAIATAYGHELQPCIFNPGCFTSF